MDKVKDALHQAYTGESKAALRLKVYAGKADEEGYPQIAKLFRVISRSEEIHGERGLRLLKEIKDTEQNLADSFESETNVAEVAYESFIKLADEADNKAVSTYFSQSRDVESFHAKLYKEAMNNMMEERDTTYYICEVCGYPSDGVLPDECPVCGAKSDKFTEFK